MKNKIQKRSSKAAVNIIKGKSVKKKKVPSIHVKLEYTEALNSKKDILLTESNLLKINEYMRNYHQIRIQELKRKINLHNKIKQLINSIARLEKTMPEVKIPQIISHEAPRETPFTKSFMEGKSLMQTNSNNSDLASQLREIQEKIKSLKR